MAGTGTLWAGGVVAGSSLGEGQMGAVASRGPEERMVTQFGGSGGGKVTVESQLSPIPILEASQEGQLSH